MVKKMSVSQDKEGRSNTVLLILMLVMLAGVVTAFLYFPPVPTFTAAGATKGDITFTDGTGSPLTGAIELSGEGGISSGLKSNVNFLSWDKVPNARIYYSALDTKSVSVSLRISGDSPKGRVIMENYGIVQPAGVNVSAPGTIVKYVKLSATGVSFIDAELSIRYTDAEVTGLEENNLAIYQYDSATQAWNLLETRVDAANNIASTAADSLSIFALVAPQEWAINVVDTAGSPVDATVEIYENGSLVGKIGSIGVAIPVIRAEFYFPFLNFFFPTARAAPAPVNPKAFKADALVTKNVALKLENASIKGKGKVILDNYGKKNPVSVPLPGNAVKFVEISVENISFSSATVTIQYSDAELNGVDENTLVLYHWTGTQWTLLETTRDIVNNTLIATTTSLSPFGVSATPTPETQLLKIVTNRPVILDDPSGWVLGTPGAITGAVADQWIGESTTIRWYILVLNSSGLAAPTGVNVTTYLKYPNGTVFYSAWALTDSNGFVNFSKDLNNLNQITTPWNVEGNWFINATATVDAQIIAVNDTFIYNEYGCGKSGTGCHDSRWNTAVIGPQTVSTFGTGTKDSPYAMGWDTIHNQSGYGALYPHGQAPQNIAYGECITCHKSYNGTYINASTRDNYQPQYSGGLHYGKTNATCTDCHAGFVPSTVYVNMPIKRCYDSGCHPKQNNNLTNLNYTQSATLSYSYFPLNTTNSIRNHTLQNTVPCITCHGDGHNITKPYNVTGASNNITEYQQCTTCHGAYQRHNNSVNCTVCHSQDAHVIKVFAQDATYINGSTSSIRGNCTNCHQNSSFLNALLQQPKAGDYTGGSPPQIPVPLNHSNDINAGRKWNATPGYWANGTTGSAQNSSCLYCHGRTMHNTSALGRPSLFKGSNIVNSTISSSTYWCASCHYQLYSSGATYNDTVGTFNFPNEPLLVPPEITGNATFGANTSNPDYYSHSGFSDYSDSKCATCHPTASSNITGFVHNVPEGSGGGPSCLNCHNSSASITKKIDFEQFARSPHVNINSGNATNNKACWLCHGNGSEPGSSEHLNNKSQVKTCSNETSCHGNLSFIYNTTTHSPVATGSKIKTNVTCEFCHSKTNVYVYNETSQNVVTANMSYTATVGNQNTSHYVVYLMNKSTDTHYMIDTVGWGPVAGPNSSKGCIYCHKTNNGTTWGVPASLISKLQSNDHGGNSCYNCHILGTTDFQEPTVVGATTGPDCVSCHDVANTSYNAPKVDVSKMNSTSSGIHRNLNKNATNTTVLTDNISKACWACHGNGTEDTGHHNVITGCLACHNATTNLTYTNASRIADLNKTKVYDHIQDPYYESINSAVWNSAVNCTTCHNKSIALFNASGATNATISSNVSHYANTSNLVTPSTNCTLCHKSSVNSTEWFANLTRHPAKSQNYTFCRNCHNNTADITTFHDQPLSRVFNIHGGLGYDVDYYFSTGFDWEKDDNTGLSDSNNETEACYACHNYSNIGDIQANIAKSRKCENCHVNTTATYTGPFNTTDYLNLRSDINDTIPYIYAHTNYSTTVVVPNQSKFNDTKYPTGCYGYNVSTGEGTCHGNSYYNRSNSGGYYAFQEDIIPRAWDPGHWTVTIDRMPNTTNCLFCHSQGNVTIRKGWGNATQVNASNMFGASSNASCYLCHTKNKSTPEDFHSSEVVKGGGPDCLGCHNISSKQNYTKNYGYIDAVNYSNSIHRDINSNNASGYGINASCWACHNSSGYVVKNNTHPDKRNTPYICVDCHLASGSRAGAYNATIIYNHYKNGTSIRAQDNKTGDIESCIGCHENENISGMRMPNNDTDYGSYASDGVGIQGGNTSFYHYGANRSSFGKTPGSYEYCIYCHRNTTGEFNTTFQDTANYSISNHSSNYNSTTPSCGASECHNSSNSNSTLHGAQLRKPNINVTLHNSSYCLNCHGLNVSSGSINYTGTAVTTYKEKHNNSVNCTECHTGSNKRNIHPMTYLQTDSTYTTNNNTGVNCTNCHQQNTFDPLLSRTPPKVSNPVQHSDNLSNGSVWNNTNPYWTNTSQQSTCNYCHGNTRHNATALGRPANWSGSNILNSSISSSGNWCAGCHYRGYSSSGKNYNNMTSTFVDANRSVPPEITNDSTYAPFNINGYYNHSLMPDYNDSTCKDCHGRFLQGSTLIKDLMHNVSTGICTNCHFNYGYMNSSGVNEPEKYVNSTMFNSSPHGSLRCEDCHTKGHNNIGARKACEDCHAVQQNPITDRDRHNITADPWNYSISGVSGSAVNITDCTKCHDGTQYSNATTYYGLPPKTNCDYCHTYPDKTYS